VYYLVMADTDWVSYCYAAAVTSGGVLGFVKAGSTASLGAGVLFGGLAGLGAYRSGNNSKDVWISLAVSASLSALMGQKFYNTRKFMPAGLTAALSIGMVGKCLYNLSATPTPVKSE